MPGTKYHLEHCWNYKRDWKASCSAGLHGGNYPLHNHMHNVNHCCIHVIIQFTEYQNCNYSSSVATLLPNIVIYK